MTRRRYARRPSWAVRYLCNYFGACALLVACASFWLILDRLEGVWR